MSGSLACRWESIMIQFRTGCATDDLGRERSGDTVSDELSLALVVIEAGTDSVWLKTLLLSVLIGYPRVGSPWCCSEGMTDEE